MGFYNPANQFLSVSPAPAVKRKAYFAFHFDDVMRVNVVRNAWKITHPDAPLARSFYDSSIWERRRLEGDDTLKRLMREGVQYTSAVCVLIGADTWSRRWVRYEIARAIIDGRGLLAVHLNNIRHHLTKAAHPLGYNPLGCMGVGKRQLRSFDAPQYYLCEWEGNKKEWVWYKDYTDPVKFPSYLPDPQPGHFSILSTGTFEYDYASKEGHKNIGRWIDLAAQRAGR
jgi:hypothetical protein